MQDPLRARQLLRLAGGHIAEKGMEGRQAHIPGGHGIVPRVLQVLQEGDHVFGLNIDQIQRGDAPSVGRGQEAQQYDQRIAVAVDGVTAHAA